MRNMRNAKCPKCEYTLLIVYRYWYTVVRVRIRGGGAAVGSGTAGQRGQMDARLTDSLVTKANRELEERKRKREAAGRAAPTAVAEQSAATGVGSTAKPTKPPP